MQWTLGTTRIGIVGAFLATFGGGLALANSAQNEHWLRGDFPTSSPAAAVTSAFLAVNREASEVEKIETAFTCEVMQGEVEAVIDGVRVLRGAGDLWSCPLKQASATPAMVRVFHAIAE